MLWGILSDVHSNIEALDAALAELERRKVERYICCGDIVGYGPDPNPVIERMAALPEMLCVRGNHDLAVLGRMDLAWFNDPAKEAVRYTQSVITEKNMNWLKDLPPRVESAQFTVVHGSPRNPAEEYMVTVQQFHDNCKYFDISPCFVGHSHLPMCFLMAEPVSYVEAGSLGEGQEILTPKGVRSVVNPGSVGQPRDHDNRASCGVYDDEARKFSLLRVEYEVEAVQKKIRKIGLPEFLAMRLSYGQ